MLQAVLDYPEVSSPAGIWPQQRRITLRSLAQPAYGLSVSLPRDSGHPPHMLSAPFNYPEMPTPARTCYEQRLSSLLFSCLVIFHFHFHPSRGHDFTSPGCNLSRTHAPEAEKVHRLLVGFSYVPTCSQAFRIIHTTRGWQNNIASAKALCSSPYALNHSVQF